MYSNLLLKITILIVFFSGLVLTSCKQNTAKTIQPAKDYALILRETSSIVPMITFQAQSSERLKSVLTDTIDSLNTCAKFYHLSGDTSTSVLANISYSIDYELGCITSDNSFQEGKLNCLTFQTHDKSNGKTLVTFDNFRIDGNLFEGSIIIENNQSGYKTSSTNLVISVGKKSIAYSGISKWEILNPTSNDTIFGDNQFSIQDSCQFTSRYGDTYTSVSTSLIKITNCRWFKSGLTEIVDSDNQTQIIDYGNGDCNNKAVISTDGSNYEIDLQ